MKFGIFFFLYWSLILFHFLLELCYKLNQKKIFKENINIVFISSRNIKHRLLRPSVWQANKIMFNKQLLIIQYS